MRIIIPVILMAFTLVCPGAMAEPRAYHAGDALEAIKLTDQHGEQSTVDDQTRLLIFIPDRDASKILHSALEKTSHGYLERHHTTCVADISGMPSLVTRFFALPRMRKYPYSLLLARTAGDSARLPRREGQVTLVRLRGLKIAEIGFAQSPAEVMTAIEGNEKYEGDD